MSEFQALHEEELVVGLHDREIIKFGEFTLKSGRSSPIYYNQRPLLSIDHENRIMSFASQQRAADLAIEGYVETISNSGDKPDHLYGIPQAATAIGACIAREAGVSYLWGRVGKKDYGKHESVEGVTFAKESVLQIDDVVTNADSKLESAAQLQEQELKTVGFVVMFDREEGGAAALEEAGYPLSSVTSLSRVVPILRDNNRISDVEIESLQAYHEDLRAEGVSSTFSYSS